MADQLDMQRVVDQLNAANQNMSRLITVISAIFPRAFGTFTMSAAATKTINDANCKSSSIISLQPTNAAAGTLMGSAKALYIAASAGSFIVSTASGGNAAGTETFAYAISNPV